MFANKKLLITGGTGSFGNAVVEKFLKEDIDEIRIFSRDEKKQDDMRKQINRDNVKFFSWRCQRSNIYRQSYEGGRFCISCRGFKASTVM